MKVTDKKFLNVHQTISPLTVATTVTASSTGKGESSPSSKAEKILVSHPFTVLQGGQFAALNEF